VIYVNLKMTVIIIDKKILELENGYTNDSH